MKALGIDIGTGSMKAAVASGGTVRFGYGSYLPSPAGTPRFSQDAAAFAASLEAFCRTLSGNGALDGLACIAVSGHGPSLVCLDSRGSALGPLVTWQDGGASAEAEELRGSVPGFSKDGTSWEAKCLAAWRRWGDRIALFLTPKDYANWLLTGKAAFDSSTASTVRFFGQDTQRWSRLPAPLPASAFPRVVEPWEPMGETGTPFSRACGFPDGVPVLGGGIDAYCETAGAGAVETGDIVEGSGTSTCISVCAEGESGDRHVVPGKRLRIETMSCTGSSIKWLDSLIGAKDSASSLPRFAPIIYHPFLDGERSPYWDERLRASFIGMDGRSGSADLRVAVLQGIAFGIRQNVEILEAGQDNAGGAIRACGGGAENDDWLRLKANVLGRPFLKAAYKDTAPLGGLRLCGLHLGLRDPLADWGIESSGERIEPDAGPEERSILDGLYREYLLTADLLAASSRRLAALADRGRLLAEERGGNPHEKNA